LLGNATIGTADLNLETLITMDNERIKKSLRNASDNLEANTQKVTNSSSSTPNSTVLPAKTDAGETYAAAVTNTAASTVKARKTDAAANTDKDVEADATENTDKAGKTDAVSNTFQDTESSLNKDIRLATSATGITKSSPFLL
jgi:hypothetical protein